MMQLQRTQAPCLKLASLQQNQTNVQLHAKARFTPISRPSFRSTKSSSAIKAVAQAPEAAIPSPSNGENTWYALVASAEFYFNDVQNEALAEQLRELKRYYEEKDREIDFFLVSEPAWLEKFPADAKKVKRPAVALVSTDKQWIVFMKLRLDRVLKIDLGMMDIDTATRSTAPVPELKFTKKWTAPYTPYAPGWWEVFMRK